MAAALVVVALSTGAACGGDRRASGSETGTRVGAEEVHPGVLHDCADGLPVPGGVEVVETALGRDQGGGPTCVVSLESARPASEVARTYLAALDAEGWRHGGLQQQGDSAMVDLHGPSCGVLLVLPEAEATSVLVSLLGCDRVRPRPAVPTTEEQ